LKKQLTIIGTVGVPACYGGFETLVENLLTANLIEEYDVEIVCSTKAYENQLTSYKGAKLTYVPLNANGVSSIAYDIFSLFRAIIKRREKVLLLGVSGAIVLPIIRLFSNTKIICNIDGLEWRREKWGGPAKAFLKLSERIAVYWSHRVIADNDAIAKHILDSYNKVSSVIAYGGDHAVTGRLAETKENYFLTLCRIEPENNVQMILEAFAKKKDQRLMFIGNWDNSEFGRKMKETYKGYRNIDLINPIYDLDELFEIRNKAKGYVHGHSAGGTNPSLVEMMFFNLDIMCFDCNYNRASTANEAVYFNDSQSLIDLLECNFDSTSPKLIKIANEKYRWSIIQSQYNELINNS